MQRRVYNLMNKRYFKKKSIINYLKPKYGNYLRGYGENKKKLYETLKRKFELEITP